MLLTHSLHWIFFGPVSLHASVAPKPDVDAVLPSASHEQKEIVVHSQDVHSESAANLSLPILQLDNPQWQIDHDHFYSQEGQKKFKILPNAPTDTINWMKWNDFSEGLKPWVEREKPKEM